MESGEAPDPSAVVEDRHVDEAGEYVRTECGAVESRVTQLSIDAECREGPVTVEAVEDTAEWAGARLGWNAGPVVLGTELDCAGARLADRLVVVPLVAQPDTVDGR